MTPVRDLNDLYFFAKVADFGSYTAAAKALGLQTSKLIGARGRRITRGMIVDQSTGRSIVLMLFDFAMDRS
jgi:hypothetical protein